MICQGFLSRIFAKSNVLRYSGNVTFAAYLQPGVLRTEQYLHWHCVLRDAGRGSGIDAYDIFLMIEGGVVDGKILVHSNSELLNVSVNSNAEMVFGGRKERMMHRKHISRAVGLLTILTFCAPLAYKVQTAWITSCVVDFDDLARFCDIWLQTGPGLKADFDGSYDVDFEDYCTVAELWLKLCPVGWPLKD